jgi:uncharacterized OB-fold protein
VTAPARRAVRRIAPAPDDLTAGFWEAAGRGVLAVQHCGSCSAYQHPPQPVCTSCGADRGPFVEVSGRARLVSWTVTHHAVVPALAEDLPYVCLVVELVEQDGLWLVSDRIGMPADVDDLRLGMPMRATFDVTAGDVVLPQFVPDETATGPEVAR